MLSMIWYGAILGGSPITSLLSNHPYCNIDKVLGTDSKRVRPWFFGKYVGPQHIRFSSEGSAQVMHLFINDVRSSNLRVVRSEGGMIS